MNKGKISLSVGTFFLALNLSLDTKAQSNYYLLYDNTFSSKVGAENLLTIHKALYSFEDKYLPPEIFRQDENRMKYLNILYRASKTIVDYPVQVFIKLIQHEVFGHGARFRELGYENISYNLNLTPPFGSGTGYTEAWFTKHITTIDENTSIDIAGVEACTILSDILRTKWVMDDSTNYNDFFLYFRAHYNITEYINKTYYYNKAGDIDAYIHGDMSAKYAPRLNRYSISDLEKYSFINLFDPFQFLAFYNWCGYIISGKPRAKLPMIKIGNAKYLPSFHLGLTPFGAEFYMDNYLKYQDHTFKIYGRYGDPRFEHFWGVGVSAFNVFKNKSCYVNATTDLWNQPSLELHNTNNYSSHSGNPGLGICFSATAGLNISKKSPASIILISGYKTDGYLPGETLAGGFFLRTGLAFLNR